MPRTAGRHLFSDNPVYTVFRNRTSYRKPVRVARGLSVRLKHTVRVARGLSVRHKHTGAGARRTLHVPGSIPQTVTGARRPCLRPDSRPHIGTGNV